MLPSLLSLLQEIINTQEIRLFVERRRSNRLKEKLTMEANKILQTDFLDLLFQDRNKAYGAYELRRSYNKRMLTALLVTCAIGTLLFFSSFLADAKVKNAGGYYIDPVDLSRVPDESIPPPPPPPPPPRTKVPPNVQMARVTPPQIVKDEDFNKEDLPPDMNSLDNTQIGLVSRDGVHSADGAIPVIDDRKGILVIKDEVSSHEPLMKVEVEAEFPGGTSAWRKFLERNLSADVAISAGAPPGSYTVVVQFIVDKDGAVSEVKAHTRHGYGLEEEAVRVIKRSGRWTPAIQNGRQVKAYRKQPVTFMVTED